MTQIVQVDMGMSSKKISDFKNKVKDLDEYSTSDEVIYKGVGESGYYASTAGEDLMQAGASEL